MNPLIKSLKARHQIVQSRIEDENRSPAPDSLRVRALKKMKLQLRDQIAFLERVGNSRPVMVVRRKPRFGLVSAT